MRLEYLARCWQGLYLARSGELEARRCQASSSSPLVGSGEASASPDVGSSGLVGVELAPRPMPDLVRLESRPTLTRSSLARSTRLEPHRVSVRPPPHHIRRARGLLGRSPAIAVLATRGRRKKKIKRKEKKTNNYNLGFYKKYIYIFVKFKREERDCEVLPF